MTYTHELKEYRLVTELTHRVHRADSYRGTDNANTVPGTAINALRSGTRRLHYFILTIIA